MWDPTPWVIAGGASHSADLARTLAFAATGGKEGVVLPGSLKVSQLSTPGAGVRISPGAATVINRSPGGAEQTYVVRNAATHTLTVPGAGGGGRSDLVVVRVEDPQFPPWQAPANPANGVYVRTHLIQNVPANTDSAADLNLSYPALAIARIDIPSGATTITDAMIKDVRKMGQPRTQRSMHTAYPTAVDRLGPNVAGFHNWPSKAWQVYVPDWATTAVVHGVVGGAKNGSVDPAANGDVDVQLAILLGTQQTEASQAEWLTVVSASGIRGYLRGDINAAGTLNVSSMRGQWHNLRFRGGIVAAADQLNGFIQVDGRSVLMIDLEFQEAPA